MTRRVGCSLRPLLAVVVLGAPAALRAQDAGPGDSLAVVKTMGLPRAFRFYGGAGGGLALAGEHSQVLSRAMFGGARDLMNPVPGLAGIAAEAWIGTGPGGADAGGRLMFASHAAGLQVGADYSLRLGRPDLALAVQQPLRRGGILVPGGGLRLDWLPGRSTLLGSLTLPLFQRWPRATRAARVEVAPVPVPRARSTAPARGAVGSEPALRQALERVRDAAWRTSQLVVPYLPPGDPSRSGAAAARLRGMLDGGEGNALAETRRYHELLDQAFELAIGGGTAPAVARALADSARSVLLQEVLIPYDRELGRLRPPRVLRALCRRAEIAFTARLAAVAGLSAPAREQALAVQRSLLNLMIAGADSGLAQWGDSRYVWLPLQYALRPEEHDTQSEIDRLVERLSGTPFEGGHDLDYATDERFEPALQRSIREARDYHVLWIHDFAGRNPDGGLDFVALQVVRAYLTALTSAAKAFDRTHKVPTFLIFLDQYYYRRSHSARWLRLLQDPLNYRLELPGRYRAVEHYVQDAQDSLRAAVKGSPALQAEAFRRGLAWLPRVFAVQINVTYPPDPSFLGPRATGTPISGFTDDLMRDHRKMAFADISERDPSRGIAILTGLGVGEHYGRFQWLDRTLVVRGPAAAVLKNEARTLMLRQGFTEAEVPAVLRPDSSAPDRASQIAALERQGWDARLAIAINEPGFGPKRATAAKAALYTLLPPGCTIVAADPQWLSRFWGSMLIGSALRGCKVLVIGPGPDNAPFSTSFVQAILQRDLYLRLMAARDTLHADLARSGGLLAIGLFRIGYGTNNVAAGVRELRNGVRRHPFLRRVFPFDQGVWDLFEQADSLLGALAEPESPDTATWYHPRFHLKTQFFGSAEAMQSALGRPEWRQFFLRRIRERLRESPAGTDIVLEHLSMLRPYLAARNPDERDRQVLYLEVGSHNQDSRSFMLDGEQLCLVAGQDALLAAGDMLLLASVGVEWLDTPPELDRYYPERKEILTEAARAAEPIF